MAHFDIFFCCVCLCVSMSVLCLCLRLRLCVSLSVLCARGGGVRELAMLHHDAAQGKRTRTDIEDFGFILLSSLLPNR
jgi:hypothetical protein